jgi:hypothetical protein
MGIIIDNVSKNFGSYLALDNINLDDTNNTDLQEIDAELQKL